MEPNTARTGALWLKTIPAILSELGCNPQGLTSDQARERLEKYGPNLLHPKKQRAAFLEFLVHFNNPLVLILIAASFISLATGDASSFIIINVIVLVSVLLDFVQEHRAREAAEKLKNTVAVQAKVLRDGKPIDVTTSEIVPGDVVLLGSGDLVPADCRILEARDLSVNQVLLTGEPYPVEKSAKETSDPAVTLSDVQNTLFMGTSVMCGNATAVVCRTADQTELGMIAKKLSAASGATAFEQGTRRFGMLIMRLTMLLVLFVLLVNSFRGKPFLQSFLFAVALAVGLTPELLPMIVSVTLARGAIRMAKKRVIVKRLSAIHDLGSMDVLCTDKTGTLTEARIDLERHINPQGEDSARVLELAYLNSHFTTGLKSPLDAAILKHKEVDVAKWRKLDEVPFDFNRRRVSVLVANGTERILVLKGAPEETLHLCTQYEGPAGVVAMEQKCRDEISGRINALFADGFRVLAIAWRTIEADAIQVGDESTLVFAGFAAFLDPPKLSAAQTLKSLAAQGVSLKIVSGDNELVTQHVCRQLGFEVTGVLLGSEISDLDDRALDLRVEPANLFCRVSPAQKERVIRALRRRGHVVGYMGDGINDAPSLHSADVGISVDGAVDIAKDAADLVLLDQDLGVLRDGVLEGRRTFANIMKYIMMGTSSNFGNMFSMAGASMFLPFLPMRPVQILLNNLLYDVSEIAIPLDSVDEDALMRPHHWDMRQIRNFMLVIGPVSSVFDFLTFYVMLHVFHAGEALFQTGWFVESMATQILVIFLIRTAGNPLRSHPSPWLTGTSIGTVVVAVIVPFTRVGTYFGMVPLPAMFFMILALMVMAYLLVVEAVKRAFLSRLGS